MRMCFPGARWVYPRVCGGTPTSITPTWCSRGLSPRVRGNPKIWPTEIPLSGSIPACAGEPPPAPPEPGSCGVYPRVCGGTFRPSSPGSIPACAGEPRHTMTRTRWTRVYPRVCGGTPAYDDPDTLDAGLSPRVRGNPGTAIRPKDGPGSIPACAGEPHMLGLPPRVKVYPRVCGGTDVLSSVSSRPQGLSPRVRGNPAAGSGGRPAAGSIPACAGEPRIWGRAAECQRVYPRVCGGTTSRGF